MTRVDVDMPGPGRHVHDENVNDHDPALASVGQGIVEP